MKLSAKLRYLLLPLMGAAVLNSCWVNMTGNLLSDLHYKAGVNANDATKSQYVLTDGVNYYLELPRYKLDKEPADVWNILEKNDKKAPIEKYKKELIQIPSDYAAYLTGKASGPEKPSVMTRVENAADVRRKASTRLPIVNKPLVCWTEFDFKDPSPATTYALLPLSFVLDVSLSAIGNAFYIPFVPLFWLTGNDECTDEVDKYIDELDSELATIIKYGETQGYITEELVQHVAPYVENAKENIIIMGKNIGVHQNNAAYYKTMEHMTAAKYNEGKTYHGIQSLITSMDLIDTRAKYAKLKQCVDAYDAWLADMYKQGRVRK